MLITKKKIIVLTIAIGLIAVSGYFIYSQLQQKTVISTQLSDRAQEYLNEKKQSDNADWRDVSLENKHVDTENVTNEARKGGDCFTLTIPFAISKENQKEGCVVDLTTATPQVRILSTQRKTSVKKLDELPEIQLRRSKPDQYKESSKQVNGRDYIIFLQTEPYFTATAFTLIDKEAFSLSFSTTTNENLEEKFNQVLSSAQFK